ncbi:Tetratricopeptide repeat protein 25 [Terramyces sp. JEL0728]|nr:Tetratricopeptide repeat protein 25 [Terramyces sp. JEL0728]
MKKLESTDGDTDGERETPKVVLWTSAIAEADIFLRQSDYKRAQELYSYALTLQPDDPHVLICRSRCKALNGDARGAERDADQVLKLDPKNAKGLLSKADALFTSGDFEMSMVWYSRGQQCRPDVPEFESGVNRCKIAIQKAMVEFDVEKLKKYSLVKKNLDVKEWDEKSESHAKREVPIAKQRHIVESLDSNLLEELFDDYLFLRDIEQDTIIAESGLSEVVSNALDFLDGRIDFWRARNPKGLHDTTVVDDVVKSNRYISKRAKANSQRSNINIKGEKKVLPKIKSLAVEKVK